MPEFLIKDTPPELHVILKQKAAHHLSITLLEQTLRGGCAKSGTPPEPVDLMVSHDSEWIFQAAHEGRE
ncbi:MAG: hypothetical protein Q8O37_15465 [Sulfuricellaceae bacterium]|nr:hypothetical protein [Sulfuricellaceae bacterium]